MRTRNSHDGHAFTVLALIDHNKHEVVGHLLINTWQNVDYFNYLDFRIDMHNYREPNDRKPLFLDASLHLQLASNDSNCVLYTHLLTKQILKLLADSNGFRELVRAPFEGAQHERAIAGIRLALEKSLAQFYTCDEKSCTRNSDQVIEAFFLNYRWRIGSEYLKDLRLAG